MEVSRAFSGSLTSKPFKTRSSMWRARDAGDWATVQRVRGAADLLKMINVQPGSVEPRGLNQWNPRRHARGGRMVRWINHIILQYSPADKTVCI
jgi:hypothetical protein